jgi:xylulokinase
LAASTSFNTTPDIGNGGGGASSTPTPLAPVTPLPTSDGELQLGLAKVADSDYDAFLSYASIVPEYYRLENILIKAIV